MKKVALFDTSVASPNLGDQIIVEAVENNLMKILSEPYVIKFQTHDVISKPSYKLIKESDYRFVAGTNLLSSKMDTGKPLWRIDLDDVKHIKRVILMGVGWLKYQGKPNAYSAKLYKELLSKKYLHSVRDSYTKKQLKSIGIKNVINTSCPTMWGLDTEHCDQIPQKKADSVVFTYSDGKNSMNRDNDKKLLEMLKQNYQQVYFWPQGVRDFQYMKSIGGNNILHVSPSLEAFDRLLRTTDIDYIGKRLHGGIRALQHKKRTLILAVDNRAAEISKDTNLPVINANNLTGVQDWITRIFKTKINLPDQNILKWIAQFTRA